MDFLCAFLKAKSLIKSLKVSDQCRAEVWCPVCKPTFWRRLL